MAAHWLPSHRYALATALTAVCGSLGQLLTTAPLSLALGDLGWTPTFAASGVLTAVLAILAVNRLQDRPAGAAPTHHAPILPTLKRAWRAPSIRHGLWVHFALNCPWFHTFPSTAPASIRRASHGIIAIACTRYRMT